MIDSTSLLQIENWNYMVLWGKKCMNIQKLLITAKSMLILITAI